MPIRFACPHCQQRLSVSARKEGTTAACPHCGGTLTIPQRPGEEQASEHPPVMNVFTADDSSVEAPPIAAAVTAVQASSMDAVFLPDAAGRDEIEIVYERTDESPLPSPPPKQIELVALPRFVLYLQGGLIALVAFWSFVLGILFGGTLFSRSTAPAVPQACLIEGSVTFASGPRQLPDTGAVVVVLPQSKQRADERAPTLGLRPGDPPPEAAHRGLAILRQLGGGYARADANGRFSIQVPSRGRYLVLVISHEKRARSADEVPTADVLRIGRFFGDAASLIGDRRYQLTEESLVGDRHLAVQFDR
jgi:hypothetical protein